jgi:hypothetical protein
MLNLSFYCVMSLCQGQMMGLVTKNCKRRNGSDAPRKSTWLLPLHIKQPIPTQSKLFSIMGNYQSCGQMAELEWPYRHPEVRNTAYLHLWPVWLLATVRHATGVAATENLASTCFLATVLQTHENQSNHIETRHTSMATISLATLRGATAQSVVADYMARIQTDPYTFTSASPALPDAKNHLCCHRRA